MEVLKHETDWNEKQHLVQSGFKTAGKGLFILRKVEGKGLSVSTLQTFIVPCWNKVTELQSLKCHI